MTMPRQIRIIESGVLLPLLGPRVHLRQLDTTDRGVDIGHAVVEADNLVQVLNAPCPDCGIAGFFLSISALATETMPPSPEVMFLVG